MPRISTQKSHPCACGNHAFLRMKRGVTIVDLQDASLLDGGGWSVNGGYAQSKKKGKLHRSVMGHGCEVVDHINHDKLDNRRMNLRPASKQTNQFNKRPTSGKSVFKGVTWYPSQGWVARITCDRKRRFLGAFPTEELAARAYDTGARKYFGEYAYLNFKENS